MRDLILGNVTAIWVLILSLLVIALILWSSIRLPVAKFICDVVAALGFVAALMTSVHFVNKVIGENYVLGCVIVGIYFLVAFIYAVSYVAVCDEAVERRREIRRLRKQAEFDAKWDLIFKMIDLKNQTPE